MFTLWSKDRLGLNAQATSYLMAYQGLLSIIVQIGLISPLTKRFSDARLITWSLPVQAAGLLAWAFTPSVPVLLVVLIPLALTTSVLNTVISSAISWAVPPREMGDALGTAGALLAWAFTPSVPVLVVVLIPLAFATGVLNTVINSAISWAVPPQEMGDALGTASALESLSRVIAPSVGGWLLGAFGAWSPGVLAAVILAGLAAFAWRRLIVHPDPPLAAAIGQVAA